MNQKAKHNIKHPFDAQITHIHQLNKDGSSKSNHHIEISIEGSEINYDVGSSFGLLPSNDKKQVQEILEILGVEKNITVHPKKLDFSTSIYNFFLDHVNILRVTKKLAQALIPYQETQNLQNLLDANWKEYTESHNIIDFFKTFYLNTVPLDDLVNSCPPLLARFYSVASSQNVVGNNIHLLIADFSYKKGTATHRSITTAHLLTHSTIRLFHQPNPSFCPPKEDTPIIMIGPGTGLAAFRGFIQERILFNKCRNNILFTGDRNKEYDFYYQEELSSFVSEGFLQLFSAFSRDGKQKVYVQDKMWQEKAMLYRLITKNSAQIYISGDAEKMAKDVCAMIEKIISSEGNKTEDEAHLEVKSLKKNKQLHLDVY